MDTVTDFLHRRIDEWAVGAPGAGIVSAVVIIVVGLSGFLTARMGFILVRGLGRKIANKWRDWHKLGPLAQSIVDTLQNPKLHKTTTAHVIQIWSSKDGVGDRELLVEVMPLWCSLSCEILGSKLQEELFTDWERDVINRTARKVYKQVNQDSKCGRAGILTARLQEAVKNSTL